MQMSTAGIEANVVLTIIIFGLSRKYGISLMANNTLQLLQQGN